MRRFPPRAVIRRLLPEPTVHAPDSNRMTPVQPAALRRAAAVALCLVSLLAAWSPAGAGAHDPVSPSTSRSLAEDPWEPINRKVQGFNDGLDVAVFGPVTHLYLRAPNDVRRGLGSAVRNLREPRWTLNALAQGHGHQAAVSAARFATNSTVGVLGLVDVAERVGLAPQPADFGQTLGRYGLRPGPYLVLPILGPHNVRDAVGRLVDTLTDPVSLAAGGLGTTFGGSRLAVSALDYRADADPALAALSDAADPYVVMRSAYLQQRDALVRQARGEDEALPDFPSETPAP